MALTSADLTHLRMELGLTHRELADFLDVKEATIRHWESGITKIHGPAGCIVAAFLSVASKKPETWGHIKMLVHKSYGHGHLKYAMGFLLEYWTDRYIIPREG